jgi:hypothetical protein
LNGFATNSWQMVTFTISNLSENFSQLWIRSQFSAGSPLVTTFLLIDAVCIEELNTGSTCMEFDDTIVTSATNRQNAFNLYGNGNGGFLNDWLVASGTPSLFASGDLANVSAYSGPQSALMGICDVGSDWNESLELIYDFSPGNTYQVSFALRNAQALGASAATVDFILLQAPINFTYQTQTGCTQVASVPASALSAYSISNLTANSWNTYNFSVSGLNATYSHLWIRPRFASGSAQTTTFILLDSLCITKSSSVGITEATENLPVHIFPNPAHNQVTIQLSGDHKLNGVKLYNFLGSAVGEWQGLTTDVLTLDVSQHAAGMYLLAVTDNQGNRTVKKLQIQRN